MARKTKLAQLQDKIVVCHACPRLARHRQQVALVKRRAFREETYWGRPVPGFGDPEAWLVIVGLAPAAHGANRTGRMFTGDRSGDFLFAALHRAGLASQADSRQRGDGLALRGAYLTAPCRCAPPQNLPTPSELARCAPFLSKEIELLPRARVFLALGAIAFRAALDHFARSGEALSKPLPKFGPRGRLGPFQRSAARRELPRQPAKHPDWPADRDHVRRFAGLGPLSWFAVVSPSRS